MQAQIDALNITNLNTISLATVAGSAYFNGYVIDQNGNEFPVQLLVTPTQTAFSKIWGNAFNNGKATPCTYQVLVLESVPEFLIGVNGQVNGYLYTGPNFYLPYTYIQINAGTYIVKVNQYNKSKLTPMCAAFFDLGGVGTVINVTCLDSNGTPVTFTDSVGVGWESVNVSVPAASSISLAYSALHFAPDGTHLITSLPLNVKSIKYFVQSGGATSSPTVSINMCGLSSGVPGTAGNGINTGFAPSTTTPFKLFVNESGSLP